MQFNATAKYIRISPYKLRPIVDVVRGKSVSFALNWLSTYKIGRVTPVIKVIESAVANALFEQENKDLFRQLVISEIKVDQGPIIRYFKPGAMGRANPQTRRLSHIHVVLGAKAVPKTEKKTEKVTNKQKLKKKNS